MKVVLKSGAELRETKLKFSSFKSKLRDTVHEYSKDDDSKDTMETEFTIHSLGSTISKDMFSSVKSLNSTMSEITVPEKSELKNKYFKKENRKFMKTTLKSIDDKGVSASVDFSNSLTQTEKSEANLTELLDKDLNINNWCNSLKDS